MKKIFNYLKDFIKKDFHAGFYLYAICFLGLFIFLNYSCDLENKWVNGSNVNSWKDYFYYFSFYSFAYYAIAVPKALVFKDNYLKRSEFWIKSGVFLLL